MSRKMIAAMQISLDWFTQGEDRWTRQEHLRGRRTDSRDEPLERGSDRRAQAARRSAPSRWRKAAVHGGSGLHSLRLLGAESTESGKAVLTYGVGSPHRATGT